MVNAIKLTTYNPLERQHLPHTINNISNNGKLTEHISSEAHESRKKITSFANKFDDKITSIKLKEVAHQLKKIEKSKTVNETYLATMMNVYELLEECKRVN